jgi:predicted phage terminase large subunit-like protein
MHSAGSSTHELGKRDAAREIIRRQRCQESLHSYFLSVPIPLSPNAPMELDEDLMGPARFYMPAHIALILDVLQRTMNRPFGRCMIFAPPGAAKSSCTSVVAPSWEMGRKKKSRLILTSYAADLAERQARRCQQIVKSPEYQDIWDTPLAMVRDAARDWALDNESEMLSAGLLAGITGNRASGAIIDDPVAGRQEADSPATQKATIEAYQDDLLTRLMPGAWLAFIMTRWNENDLAGAILPADYAGESGMILCRDGLYWEVLNIPAKCERSDDPLGRAIGEYLWPEWFPTEHWQIFERNESRTGQRTWSSLYQQRPTPMGNSSLDRSKIVWSEPKYWPPRQLMRVAGISDLAVTESLRADWTEHAVFGMDAEGKIYLLDTWSGQVTTDKGIESLLAMASRNGVRTWFDEKGVIHNSVGPALNKAMREKRIYLDIRPQPSNADKVAKVQGFIAVANTGIVHAPARGPHHIWMQQALSQVEAMPAGKLDDKADVLGILGRIVDQIMNAPQPPPPRQAGIKPFSPAWVEWKDKLPNEPRYR